MNDDEVRTSSSIARSLTGLFYLVFALVLIALDEVYFQSGITPVQRLGLFLFVGLILNVVVDRIVRRRARPK